jgi:hypothetical protein
MKIIKVLLVCAAIVLGFIAPDLIKSLTHDSEIVDINDYCVLSTAECQQNGVTMTLEHDTAKPLVPSEIVVSWPNSTNDSLILALQGLEMDMGVAKYQLNKQENGTYIGSIMLPVCVQDKMTWIGTLSDGSDEVYPAIRMER